MGRKAAISTGPLHRAKRALYRGAVLVIAPRTTNKSNDFKRKWRRRRDSNPRYGNTPYGGLANRWFQPLTHVSERGSGSAAIVARFQSFNRTGVSAERRRGAWSASSPHPDRAPAFQAPPTAPRAH